jgi:dTDP-glucose 4,6-dehydratase|tara:strand:- start:2607 stop:3551 length:945 start_codon:yes stop_codon:yes gene_type:complete
MRVLVTGGAGFIGSNFIKYVLDTCGEQVTSLLNVDCLSYASNEKNCSSFKLYPKYCFRHLDITSMPQVTDVFRRYQPTHVVHFAAETHVDNSIKNSSPFIDTNITGTNNLLRAATRNKVERFHHISTDEVYGSLGDKGKFKETTPYDPRNPYSASKAASDHLVRASYHTFGLPITISNCSNNYGPNQHKEKFIPTILTSLLKGKKIPVYGQGSNVRDWIYVEDHCDGIWKILTKGTVGETYNVGATCEKTNLEVIEAVCNALNIDFSTSIEFVKDRLGHDFRYAIDASKMRSKLSWKPSHTFKRGLLKTIAHYA